MNFPRLTPDSRLPRIVQILLLIIAGSIPVCYVARQYDPQTKFTSLILFGERLAAREVPAVREMHPPLDSPDGYDGEFYAQIALDPLLLKPETKIALDNPFYRSKRILLPVLAFCAGSGKPGPVIQAYALLNPAFWFLLLFGMASLLKAETSRDYLCILATVFTTGAIISVERSLTDLPATVLCFYGTILAGVPAAGVIMMAVLLRETSAICLLRYAWPLPRDRAAVLLLARKCLIILLPLILWMGYVRHTFGSMTFRSDNFGWPMVGWAGYVVEQWRLLCRLDFSLNYWRPTEWEFRMFEVTSAFSLLYQAAFLLLKPAPACRWWPLGAGFALLFLFCNRQVFVEQIGTTRTLLPMTLAFNISLMPLRGRAFVLSFFAGNFGLLWGFREMLGCCLAGVL